MICITCRPDFKGIETVKTLIASAGDLLHVDPILRGLKLL